MNNAALLILLPLLAAFLVPILHRVSASAGRWSGPLVLLGTAYLGLSLWVELGDTPQAIALGGFQPPLGIALYVDPLALLFAVATLLGTLLLWPYGSDKSVREYTLTLLLAAAGCAMALSGDLFNIYVFYELIALVSYGLIASSGTGPAFLATLRYLILSAFGAALALIGIGLVYYATGTLNLAHLAQLAPEKLNNVLGLSAFMLILIGIGVKAELFPVNTWVPEVYATASKRVSGLLAGLVSKLAVLVLVRMLVLVFPIEQAMQTMLVLGILGVVTGELAAWRAKDFTRMLAYSSIGQLGIVFIAFSVPGKAGMVAGIAVALHHLVVKPALFLLAERWGGSLERLTGVARQSPLGAVLFILFALSLIGVPPLPGFWAKLLVLIALMETGTTLYALGAAAVLFGAVVEANYLFRLATGFYARPRADAMRVVEPHRAMDMGIASALGVGLVACSFVLTPLGASLEGIASLAADAELYVRTVAPALPGGAP